MQSLHLIVGSAIIKVIFITFMLCFPFVLVATLIKTIPLKVTFKVVQKVLRTSIIESVKNI